LRRSQLSLKVPRTLHLAEMVTVRFAGWMSCRIVGFQPDTDIERRSGMFEESACHVLSCEDSDCPHSQFSDTVPQGPSS